jgi:hypothetical protein
MPIRRNRQSSGILKVRHFIALCVEWGTLNRLRKPHWKAARTAGQHIAMQSNRDACIVLEA